MPAMLPLLKSSKFIKKLDKPILTADDIPYDANLVFNAGVTKYNSKYVMTFRVDHGASQEQFENNNKNFTGTYVGVAFSDNGIDNWQVSKIPLIDSDLLRKNPEIKRLYDPRITVIDNKPYLCLAMDTAHGVLGCISEINDSFDEFKIISTSTPDNRNMVLFPEKINDRFVRLERPMPVYSRGRDRFDIWLSESPDLVYWGKSRLVMGVESVPFANDKIGPAAPPIKTEKGWLTTFHAVDIDENRGKNGWEQTWKKRYSAGIMLLDFDDPSKIIGMSKEPLIASDKPYETDEGFRQDVIFPGGMILEESGEVKIYYGASDTYECVATADVNDLLSLCLK